MRVFYLLLCFLPFCIFANEKSNWHAGVIGADFNYQERYDTGQLANKESGFLTGIFFTHKNNNEQYFYQSKVSYLTNEIDYKGFNLGSDNAIYSNSNAKITQLSIKTGLAKPLKPYLLADYYIWDREIESTNNATGLDEVYKIFSLGVGINPQLTSNISLDLSYLKGYKSDIEITPKSGFYQTTKFDLGNNVAYQAQLSWQYENFTTQPFYRYLKINRSNNYLVYRSDGSVFGSIFEPKSKSSIFGINIYYNF